MTENRMIRVGDFVVSKPAGGYSGAVQYNHWKAETGQFRRTALWLHRQRCFSMRRKIWQPSGLGHARIPVMEKYKGGSTWAFKDFESISIPV
jgi:hypothetical protein